MNEITTTDAIDELVLPLQTELSRRDLLKRIGGGGLAVASAAVLSPLGAEAAYATSLSNVSLRIDKTGLDAKIKVYYTLRMSSGAMKEIRSGVFRYGVWFKVYHADRSLGSDWNYDDELVREWSSGPLPAQSPFVHSTSQTMRWSTIRSYGSEFYAQLRVYKKEVGRQTWMSSRVSTRSIKI